MLESLGFFASPDAWLLMLVGVVFGTICGALPGVSTTLALVITLPFTFFMPMIHALIVLISVYVSSVYGGSISAILLRIPGTAASIVTTFDGYPMAQQGRAGLALGSAALASFIGTIFTAGILIGVGPLYVDFAMKFGCYEIFMVALWGLILSVLISPGSKLKGLVAAIIGVVLACIGLHTDYSAFRFTFGSPYLMTGVPLLPVIVGLFGITVILQSITTERDLITRIRQQVPRISGFVELLRTQSWIIIGACSLIGFLIGAIPGTGAIVATLVSYAVFSRFSKRRDEYGKGCTEGVLVAETANNAVNPGAVLTTLVLGVPGACELVILLGAFTLHGLRCGPMLLIQYPEYLYTIFFSFIFSGIITFILAWTMLRFWVKMIETPKAYFWPIIILLCLIGVYSVNCLTNDVLVMFGIGVLGYFGERAGFSVIPLLMGFVLGPIMELNLTTALWIEPASAILQKPLALGILLLIIITGFVFTRFLRRE